MSAERTAYDRKRDLEDVQRLARTAVLLGGTHQGRFANRLHNIATLAAAAANDALGDLVAEAEAAHEREFARLNAPKVARRRKARR